MQEIRIATAQFEHRSSDKLFNLRRIHDLSAKASLEGANVIAFHECSITGYTFARELSYQELFNVAEYLPESSSVKELKKIAEKFNITILAGLFEKEGENIYKTYVCVDKTGLKASHRKLHPFINKYITPGNQFTIFEIHGWKCGILICYDNNIVENVRATNLLGADILFMPHVTMCTPSPRPGAGFVDPQLWKNRKSDPTSLRLEFDGMKGREWLMKWLPSRAYDNAMYVIFSNAIGMDHDQLKNGCSMILDPFGDIIAECRKLDDDLEIATITQDKLENAGGWRYKMARRPELYKDIIGAPHQTSQKVAWLNPNE